MKSLRDYLEERHTEPKDPYRDLVMADWLEEHQEPLAPAFRYMVIKGWPWTPHRCWHIHSWDWWRQGSSGDNIPGRFLPTNLFHHLGGYFQFGPDGLANDANWKEYHTRLEAEEALLRALTLWLQEGKIE